VNFGYERVILSDAMVDNGGCKETEYINAKSIVCLCYIYDL
jgi:hypothetical protein